MYCRVLFPQIRTILIDKLTSVQLTDNKQAQIRMSALIEVSQEPQEFSSKSQVKRLKWCGYHPTHTYNRITVAIFVRLHQHDVARACFCKPLQAVTGKRSQRRLLEIDTASKEYLVDY